MSVEDGLEVGGEPSRFGRVFAVYNKEDGEVILKVERWEDGAGRRAALVDRGSDGLEKERDEGW